MNTLFTALLCIGLAVLALSASTEKGFCDTRYGKISVGEETHTEHPCAKHICHSNGTIFSLGCPEFQAPGCKIVRNEGKYPECCPRPVCPSEES